MIWLLIGASGGAAAQLTSGPASSLALGGHTTATSRALSAITVNPAGLGLSPRGTSFAVLPVQVGAGLEPVTLGDLAEWSGEPVPRAVRESWLDDITQRGGESGVLSAHATAFAIAHGSWGVQFSTEAVGEVRLNRDAGELLLFGNAGLSGEPQTFDLDGSIVDGFVTSKATLAYGHDLGSLREGRMSIGVAGNVVFGHAILVARDRGTVGDPTPIEIDIDFPVLSSPSSGGGLEHGTGFGIDLGVAWERRALRIGATVRNVVNTFGWRLDDLVFRAGQGLIDQEDSETDFEERPPEQAPEELRQRVLDLGMGPEAAVGAAWMLSEDVEVVGDVWIRDDRGMALGPDWRAGLGSTFRPAAWIDLKAHASLLQGGVGFGGGLTFHLGPVRVDTGVSSRFAGSADATLAAFGLSFGGVR